MQSVLLVLQNSTTLFELRLAVMEHDTIYGSTRFDAQVRIE